MTERVWKLICPLAGPKLHTQRANRAARYLLDADWTDATWTCSRVNADRLGGRLWPSRASSGRIERRLPAWYHLSVTCSLCCRSGRVRQTAGVEAHRSRRGRRCCVCFFRPSHPAVFTGPPYLETTSDRIASPDKRNGEPTLRRRY